MTATTTNRAGRAGGRMPRAAGSTGGGTARGDGQRAFVALLARPQLTPASDPDTHRQVTRNLRAVEEHARRLAYRVATIGRVIRLVRVPVAGQVTLPPAPVDPPSRQMLALTCVLAAACEEATGRTTIAKLSELVSQITSSPDATVAAYDQARIGHRRTLLAAAGILQHWGVLVRQLSDDRLLGDWESSGDGVGTVHAINREALLLLTNPETLAAVLEHTHLLTTPPPAAGNPTGIDPDSWAGTRSVRLLRALVETPAVCYADLNPDDADALRGMRGIRSNDAVTITGGHVEARAEGLVLVLPETHSRTATLDWPRAETRAWAALVALDAALQEGRRDDDGRVHLTAEQARTLTGALVCGDKARYLSVPMRNADVLHEAVTAQLTALGLLQVTSAGNWLLSAAAARYRNPALTFPDPADQTADPAMSAEGADSAAFQERLLLERHLTAEAISDDAIVLQASTTNDSEMPA